MKYSTLCHEIQYWVSWNRVLLFFWNIVLIELTAFFLHVIYYLFIPNHFSKKLQLGHPELYSSPKFPRGTFRW